MKKNRLVHLRRRLVASTRNALELARLGRLGEPYSAPYDIVEQAEHHRVRRYATTDRADAPAALLIPPLMVTAEVYDVAPDVSAVAALGACGITPYVVDFGAPERVAGGMRRTLDDHVRAVLSAIDRVRALSGRDVHLLGYSQGGMFCYQAAAYRRCTGIRSIITFGSPVDIHKSLPAVRADLLGAFVRVIAPLAAAALTRIEGLPGTLTSTAFKLVSTRKEIQQRAEFLGLLHDRAALLRREARRRFLGGEGFVAWPGPAFRAFVEDFIIHNRMLSGGFVIDGRTLSLADLTCPVLAFVGANDEIARPPTVRAIVSAAPDAYIEIVSVPSGHFGIVVGSRAMKLTWPTVADWIEQREREEAAPRPQQEAAHEPPPDEEEPGAEDLNADVRLFVEAARDSLQYVWGRFGELMAGAYDVHDALRYQEPRLRRLAELRPDARISSAQVLAEQAEKTPDAVFFLWGDRAFSYRDADRRVSNVARGLWSLGVREGDRVAVVMRGRPSFLSVITALNRLGAVAIVAPPDASDTDLRTAITQAGALAIVADPELAERMHAVLDREVWVLGGGGRRTLGQGLVDMESIDVARVELPAGIQLNGARARDLALVLLRPSEQSGLRAASVTNHRWMLSALGAAGACTIKPADTVYCCIPLWHPTGMLVSVGAALAGGARLALADGFAPERFFADVRRYGATVVFYAGEMLRFLLHARPGKGDRSLPIRLFAGSGMRRDLAEKLKERFGAAIMEFYAGTTQKVILADASGKKPGALGRVLPGSTAVRLVHCDLSTGTPLTDATGGYLPVRRGEPGLLLARMDDEDSWFVSNDVLKQDEDGDFWFVDARTGFVSTAAGPVSTRQVEGALYGLAEVEVAAVWGEEGRLRAAVVARERLAADRLDAALAGLAPHERPATVAQLGSIPMGEGFRPKKGELAALIETAGHRLLLNASTGLYLTGS